MAVIGELTVNLAANTAEFTDSMGKSKSELSDFGSASKAAGEKASFSMLEARGSVMLLGREFGIAMPREISRMIATIPGVGAALSSLLPIMGAVFAVGMIYKWYEEAKKAAEELKTAWANVGKVSDDVFDRLDDKLLEVQKKTDELAGNHIAALAKQLQLIDRQTLSNIIGEIDNMGKAADEVFVKMQSNWFMQLLMGRADVGPAKDELAGFIAELDKLKGTGADPGLATRSLLGLDIEQVSRKVADLQGQIKGYSAENAAARKAGDAMASDANDRRIRAAQQQLDLEKQNLSTLTMMKATAAETTTIGEGEKKIATLTDEKRSGEDAKRAQEAYRKVMELHDKAIKELIKQTEDGWKEESRVNDEQLKQQMAQRKKAADEGVKAAKANLMQLYSDEQEHDEDIFVLIKEQEDKIKQAHELGLTDRIQFGQQMTAVYMQEKAVKLAILRSQIEEEKALAGSAMKEGDAGNTTAQDEALRKKAELTKKLSDETAKYNALIAQQPTATKMMIKGMTDFQQASNRAFSKAVVEGKGLGTAMRQIGVQMTEDAIQYELRRVEMAIASSIKKRMMAHMEAADKVATNAAANAATTADDKATAAVSQLSHAKAWASGAGSAVASIPFIGPILAPIAAAVGFAAAMAFANGGTVPGYGGGDTVPAMLSPGETVVTKALTDQVKSSERSSGGSGGGTHVHMHINAVDAAGFEGLIKKHSSMLQKHVTSAVRRANR